MILHASSVAFRGKGMLILGASGAGKSSLALELMAFGAGLIADDRTMLRRIGDQVIADAPDAIRGQIEARGVGILGAKAVGPAVIDLVVDLDRRENQRLPLHHCHDLLGIALPLVLGAGRPYLSSAIMQYLIGGRVDRE